MYVCTICGHQVGASLHKESIAELCARLKETSCAWTSLDLTHSMVSGCMFREREWKRKLNAGLMLVRRLEKRTICNECVKG